MVVARRRTGPANEVRDLVHRRDGGRCARCGSPDRLTVHHRVNRGMGGSRAGWINEAPNLLLVCEPCNGFFEDHPAVSYEAGWKVQSWRSPGDVAVRYADGRLYRLGADGRRTVVAEVRV